MERFNGDLKYINPNKLVSQNTFNRMESFFLGLAVIFNDLKSILLFLITFQKVYEKIEKDEITTHSGNYGGTIIYLEKLLASTLTEFFIFLKKNNEVFLDNEFKRIFNRLPKNQQKYWENMVSAANNNNTRASDFIRSINMIRSNIAFHYDHSGKILRRAYINKFFNNKKDATNEKAYYSVGNNFEKTRFFFADAAVEEALQMAIGKKLNATHTENESMIEYQNNIQETIKIIRDVIHSLLKNYLAMRRNNQ